MNDRFDNDRDRKFGAARSDDERRFGRRPGFNRSREEDRGYQASAEPRYSSDEDESYGSEWQRGREDRSGRGSAQSERDSGWYGHGNAGMYGSGSTGYVGGRGGYGGSSGTSYGGDSSEGGRPGGYGSTQGGSYGSTGSRGRPYVGSWDERGFGADRGFGSGRDQGYRGRDFGIAGAGLPGSGSTGGGFAGRGPKGYTRSDERIREDVSDRLSADDDVDASEIEVRVQGGEVTLSGSVQTRSMKHHAENLADDVLGVKDVHNNLRVVKGLLTEIKDKLSGSESEQHFANGGTKNAPQTSHSTGTNGRL